VNIYIDGAAQTVTTPSGTLTDVGSTPTSFNIGDQGESVRRTLSFGGQIDDLAIWNQELSAQRVEDIFNGATVADPPHNGIAFIDINAAKGVPSIPDSVNGNYWNSTNTETDTVALVDTSNVATGWTLDTQRLAGAGGSGLSGALNNTNAPASPYDVPKAYADSWWDSGLGGSKGEFSFSGLVSSLQYELKLFGDRNGTGVDGTIAFTAGTADGGPTFTIEPGIMLTLTATPNASGVITFTLDRGPVDAGTADINLMSIREIPEPATVALLCAGAIGVMRRRRRRA